MAPCIVANSSSHSLSIKALIANMETRAGVRYSLTRDKKQWKYTKIILSPHKVVVVGNESCSPLRGSSSRAFPGKVLQSDRCSSMRNGGLRETGTNRGWTRLEAKELLLTFQSGYWRVILVLFRSHLCDI